MMSKVRNMSGVAWLVIGVSVTTLIMPTAAFAAGITWSGIEGQNKNKADVTSAGQLMTSPADVSSSFLSPMTFVNTENNNAPDDLYDPPSGEAAVITSIHVSSFALSGQTPFSVSMSVRVSTSLDATCRRSLKRWTRQRTV